MEVKIILYVVAGLIYFVYKQYIKLQAEAIKRKAILIKTDNETPIENTVHNTTVIPRRNFKKINIQTTEKMPIEGGNSIHSNTFTPIESLEPNKHQSNWTSNDFKNMILHSELLKRPVY